MSIEETLEYQARSAAAKVAFTAKPVPYTLQSMLAGSYIGIAVVLMVSAAGPFHAAGSPATKLIQGLVFGVALTLVFTAGGELVTSTMMTVTQGAWARAITWWQAARTIMFCFFANMLGAFVFAAMVHFTGLLDSGTPAGAMLADVLEGKSHEGLGQLFWRGVLCNMLVCLAIWSTVRLKSEGAKLFTIFWCLLAFITSGFEHVVANMTSFALGLYAALPAVTWGEFARNMAVVGFGNLVGGAVVVGLAYAVSASRAGRASAVASASRSGEAGPAAQTDTPSSRQTLSTQADAHSVCLGESAGSAHAVRPSRGRDPGKSGQVSA